MRFTRRTLFQAAAAAPLASARHAAAPGRVFRGDALREIAFPLGGIGTGTVSLGGYGNLRDWEIFNRPNKGGVLPFTFAAVRLSGAGLRSPCIRVLESQQPPPFSGGFGAHREQALGLPRFRSAVFEGAYPFARLDFADARLPVSAGLEAFNPMIPLDEENSSLPVAVLSYRFTSRATAPLQLAVALSAMNPVGYDGMSRLYGKISDRHAPFFGQNLNEFRREDAAQGILMSSRKYDAGSPRYGSLAIATSGEDVSWRLAWEHGEWWDDFQKWWDEFLEAGRFPNLPAGPSNDGVTEYATLACHFTLAPGESRTLDFVLAWHFPNIGNYAPGADPNQRVFRNQYGTRWRSAWEPAHYLLRNLKSLRERSMRYRDALHSSTLPPAMVDAISSQASIVRTNTVMVAENNVVFAFEGCGDNEGCCPMNCTHVFNYEQSLAHLYPRLERSMRDLDFLMNLRPDGGMSFRTPIPPVAGGNKLHPAADGQMGCVMKVYREWLLCGDDVWLRRLWPGVKRALEYAWVQWDADRDGVMEGEQHNTYDINFYGPNSMMGSLYLGALAAASRMAAHLGDLEAAAAYDALRQSGGQRLDQQLWNGEYYIQKVREVKGRLPKYQFGEGCLSDQLLGQWFAEVVGLGKLLPREHVRMALESIVRYNFREGIGDLPNTQRLFALDEEAGLLLCSWPKGKRPALPFVYSDEVWTGIEYHVAAHLLYEGMEKEAAAIVNAVRNRYDGIRRNPWNEVECGHHYARAMSSWSLLTAYSGFRYSAPARQLRFHPLPRKARFRCLFVAGSCWGVYTQQAGATSLQVELRLEEGSLELATLVLPFQGQRAKVNCVAPHMASVRDGSLWLAFNPAVKLDARSVFRIGAAAP